MEKRKELEPSAFWKVVFGSFSLAALAAAVILPDRSGMFRGFLKICLSPAQVTKSYFAYGGLAGTFLNAALVGAICTGLYCLPEARASAPSVIAFFLTFGFGFWGTNPLNMIPSLLGIGIYSLVKKEAYGRNVNFALYATGLAPLITDLLFRYPGAEWHGFTAAGAARALVIGCLIAFFLPAGCKHSPNVHKGYDLYSAAVPVGVTAFFLRAVLYKALGGVLPEAEGLGLKESFPLACNIFCGVAFLLCIFGATLMGCSGKKYLEILRDPGYSVDFSDRYGPAPALMNVGIYGLFIVLYYNLIGASFNAVTLGCIFCMLACADSGSHPGNVWPIMVGYVVASLLAKRLFHGEVFSLAINAQAIVVGLCFANGLSPISGKYGWPFGILAGMMHYGLVTCVPLLHGGFCLYNGGFTAAFVALWLSPVLEHFCKTKEERRQLRAEKARS